MTDSYNKMRIFIPKRIASIIFLLLVSAIKIYSLPLYTARSGRICDNCHVTPFANSQQEEWKNPPLDKRKCNLSCQTCHTEPNGGGRRTAVGRYYSFATLPIFNQEKRPYWDNKRNIKDLLKVFKLKKKSYSKKKKSRNVRKKRKQSKPDFYSWSDPLQFGNTPSTKQSPYALKYGLYGKINASPFFGFGGNLRGAFIKTETSQAAFPMQMDFNTDLHPAEHITIAGTLGVLGQAKDITKGENKSLEQVTYVIRNAYLKLHELPYQSYARIGAFSPAFGQRVEDHTTYTRSKFGFDLTNKNSSVFGVEIGMAPNYPYLTASFFTNQVGNYSTNGWGAALNMGWRDLAFGGGTSLIIRKRNIEFGGDTSALSFDWYFNIGRYFLTIPIVFSGEFAWGQKKDSATSTRTFYANFARVDYLIFNGINLNINSHFYDDDFKTRNDEIGRFGAGVDINIVASVKLIIEHRWKWSIAEDKQWRRGNYINPYDFLFSNEWMIQLHTYL